jgi:hypothetical protein
MRSTYFEPSVYAQLLLSVVDSRLRSIKMADFMNLNIPLARKIYKIRRETDMRNCKALYRFNSENVDWLADHFLPKRHETRCGALSNKNRMRIFLRYLGDPGFQTGVAEDIGIHQSTVPKVFCEVMEAIYSRADVWIKFPTFEERMTTAKEEWQQRYHFPCAVGALDCTHVPIMKPSQYGDEYINRKGFASINVQVTCDSNELFTSIDASWPGSVHDARIWKNSDVCRILQANTCRALLLADEGYGVAPWLMTPFRNPDTPEEHSYNRLHKERMIIERCFGQVKQRFPILHQKVRLATEKIPRVITCCFMLHNTAKHLRDPDFEVDFQPPGVLPVLLDHENATRQGKERRFEIANLIHNYVLN